MSSHQSDTPSEAAVTAVHQARPRLRDDDPIVFGGARNQLATPWLGRSEPVDGVNADCATTAVVAWIGNRKWHRFSTLLRQRHDDAKPLVVDFPPSDEEGDSEDLLQCTWNALIADFVGAVRDNDQTLHKQPDLPTLTDSLRTEQVIAAARQSNAARRWVDIGE